MLFKIVLSFFISYLIVQGSVFSVEIKDATLRDEDISATVLSVEHFTRPDGLYEYVYTINSPIENKGEIDELQIDLACDVEFDPIMLPFADGQPGYEGDFSDDVKLYTPTAIHADYGSAAVYAISKSNTALWGTRILPSNFITGFRLISPAEPGLRSYEISPWVDYDESWLFPDDESLVPDTIDFTITGMIAAPGCPGVTEPPAVALFAGSGHHHESENINKLLQYKAPDKTRFHVDKGMEEFEFHIYYSEDVDAKTFKVQPGYLKNYFKPVAGTNEKVTLPLKKYRNKIKLSVHSLKKEDKEEQKNKHQKSKHAYKDTDKFEIRVSGKRKHRKHHKNKHE